MHRLPHARGLYFLKTEAWHGGHRARGAIMRRRRRRDGFDDIVRVSM